MSSNVPPRFPRPLPSKHSSSTSSPSATRVTSASVPVTQKRVATSTTAPIRRQLRPGFGAAPAAGPGGANAVITKIIQDAKSSGRLNFSSKALSSIPSAVFAELLTPEDDQAERPAAVEQKIDRGDSNAAWWEVVELTKLILADNQIQELDERIAGFTALTTLDARNNRIKVIPQPILESLGNLTILNVSHNNLNSITFSPPSDLPNVPPPGILTLLPLLTELHLTDNKLSNPFCLLPIDTLTPNRTLRILDLSRNKLQLLPTGIRYLYALQKLSLAGNELSALEEEESKSAVGSWWENMKVLTDLDVSKNALGSDPTKPLFVGFDPNYPVVRFEKLARWDVRHNRLRVLGLRASVANPADVGLSAENDGAIEVPALKELLVSFNKPPGCTLIDPKLLESCAESLETLEMRENEFNEIPQGVLDCRGLKRLDFCNNNVQRLPPELGLLTDLDILLMTGNPLRGIPTGGTARILKYLRDRITSDSSSLPPPRTTATTSSTSTSARSRQPSTETLSAPLARVRAMTEQHISTRTLDLSTQKLDDKDADSLLTEWFGAVKEAEAAAAVAEQEGSGHSNAVPFAPVTVLLGVNRITKVPETFGRWCGTSLECLLVKGNLIAEFPMVSLPKLKILDLSNNRIERLPLTLNPDSYPSLTTLTLSNNRLTSIAGITAFSASLDTLLANDNKIVEIPVDEILGMHKLSVLDLSNNNIESVPPRLGLASLGKLGLHGNVFKNPRVSILDKGTEAILAYLKRSIPE
ncbi:hypothetical protein BJ742DRAFT_864938 [Cladochytrium replicatum]|nr:hypothetical protein BJ742DRAFT_864938 [Cladochytrium replicatum]